MDTKIVLLNGPPGSGKDTAADLLNHVFPTGRKDKFARPVKEGVHGMFRILGADGRVARHNALERVKDVPHRALMGMTPREAYIWYSEEVMKPKFGKDVFGKMFVQDNADKRGPIFVSDSGFEEEAYAVVEHFGMNNVMLVRLHREGHDFSRDSRSHLNLDLWQTHDIMNPGEYGPFFAKLKEVVEPFLGPARIPEDWRY